MENVVELLLKIAVALPFGLGAIFFLIKGLKRSKQFFFQDYQGNSKARFRDNLLSSLYISLTLACIIAAVFGFKSGPGGIKTIAAIIPIALCMGIFILPIAVLGGYWRAYQTEKLWGGFMPTIRARYGYSEPTLTNPQKIALSKLNLPRWVYLRAAGVALFVFIGVLFLASKVQWNGADWVGILVAILFAGVESFGIFMTIVSTFLSRRIQKIRNGELLDDD